MKLLRIGFVIVEFGLAVTPAGEAPAGGADALAVQFLTTRHEREGRVFDAGGGIGQNGAQAGSGGCVRHFQAAEVGDGRIHINELGERARRLAAFHARRGDDERCTATALEQRVFVPPLPLARVVAVIADEDDDGIFPELMFVERIEHATELRIHEARARAVGAKQLLPLLRREFGKRFAVVAKANALFSRRRHVSGIAPGLQRAWRIEIEVFLRRDEGIMRLHKPAADEPWRVAELLDHRHRGRSDLTIGLIVIRAIRRAPLAPFQRPAGHVAAFEHFAACLRRFKSLRRVPGAARVHPALLRFRILAAAEMVELSKRMRLPACVFAELRQRHDLRHRFAQRNVISHDARLLRPQSGHHAAAARIAHRILHIRPLKRRAASPQPVEVRRLHEVLRERPAKVPQIIRRDEQHVGLRESSEQWTNREQKHKEAHGRAETTSRGFFLQAKSKCPVQLKEGELVGSGEDPEVTLGAPLEVMSQEDLQCLSGGSFLRQARRHSAAVSRQR